MNASEIAKDRSIVPTHEACALCHMPLAEGASLPNRRAGWYEGANPWPLAEDGRACDMCDQTKVLPARLSLYLQPERKSDEKGTD